MRGLRELDGAEKFDLGRVGFWIVVAVVAWRMGWLEVLTFTAVLSVWALAETAWGAFRGGQEKRLRRIEEKLDRLLED